MRRRGIRSAETLTACRASEFAQPFIDEMAAAGIYRFRGDSIRLGKRRGRHEWANAHIQCRAVTSEAGEGCLSGHYNLGVAVSHA